MQTKEKYEGTNRLLIGICLAVSTYWLFTTAMGVLLPSVATTFHVKQSVLTTPISLAGLFSGILIVALGGFADRFGRRLFTLLGIILTVIGSLMIILAPTILIFSLGRIIQGMAAAFIMPATLSLIKVYYNGTARQRAVSYWSIASWGGSGLSNLFGGFIATFMNWQMLYVIAIGISIIAYVMIRTVPESSSTTKVKGFDYIGLFFLISGLFCLNIYLTHVMEWSFFSIKSILFLVYSLFAIGALIFTEKRMENRAIIDLKAFKSRKFSGSVISNFLLNLVAGGTFVYMAFLQNAHHLNAFNAGLLTIGYLIAVVSCIRLGEKLLQKWGGRYSMLLGCGLAFIGFACVSLTFLPETTYMIVSFIGLSIMGIGLGIYATPSTDTAVSELSVDHSASGSGIYKMASSLGGSFGVVIGGTIYALNTTIGYTLAAQYALMGIALTALLAFASIYFVIPKEKVHND